MRSDVIKVYKDVHTWVGIIAGFALFIAFYAGALTMFESQVQRWASAPNGFEQFTPLDETPRLLEQLQAQYPETQKSYQVVLEPTPEFPARVNWQVRVPGADEHDHPVMMHADLGEDGRLIVLGEVASPVAQLIDDLHRQIGIMLDHHVAMPIMGVIALMYGVALISGLIVLLPTLVKDLFAFRQGKNLKRMWLDMHNVLGLFSLPFHLIMAITAVAFALHDQLYDAQETLVYRGAHSFEQASRPPLNADPQAKILSPAALVNVLSEEAPGFVPNLLSYTTSPQGAPMLRVFGVDPRYGSRSPTGGVAIVDAHTGKILMTDYTPGMQTPLSATITSFFTLHFGSFGGSPIRWGYFVLGLAGALLFYTGNLLYVETRRKKLKRNMQTDSVQQSRSTQILGALTVGVCLGCVAGISLSLASAKLVTPQSVDLHVWHTSLYYLVFFVMVVWALVRGAARAAVELLTASAVCTWMIPLMSLLSLVLPGFGWNHPGDALMVDVLALFGGAVFMLLARKTRLRIKAAPYDSIWFVGDATKMAEPHLAKP